MATTAKKTSANGCRTTSAKAATATDSEYVLWADVEKKYPGYHIIFEDPVYKTESAVYPIKGKLVAKHRNLKKLGEISHGRLTGKHYAFLYSETAYEKKHPKVWVL